VGRSSCSKQSYLITSIFSKWFGARQVNFLRLVAWGEYLGILELHELTLPLGIRLGVASPLCEKPRKLEQPTSLCYSFTFRSLKAVVWLASTMPPHAIFPTLDVYSALVALT